jgi:hypothetical protein
MTFTTEGMRWEGLFRALQSEITTTIAILILTTIAYLVARRAVAKTGASNTTKTIRSTINRVFVAVILIAIAALAWRIATFSAINRLPRADADKSSVYEQMKRNTGESQQR